jgi:Flp pilus assembly protein CpaB
MRRGRVLILLALLLIFGAAVVFLLSKGIKPTPTETPSETPVVMEATVILAAQNIPRGALIQGDALYSARFPQDMVVEGMVTDPAQIVNHYARTEIARGMPITLTMVTDKAGDLLETGSEAALAIEPGFTAIAIPMSRLSGVAYAVQDGDQVDVLVSLMVVDLDQGFQTVLPNISMIFVGPEGPITGLVCDNLTETGCTSSEPRPVGRVETDTATAELLYVTPSEVQRPRLVTQRIVQMARVLHVGTYPLEGAAAATVTQQTEGGQQQVEQAPVPVMPDIITLIVRPQEALALNYAVKAGLDIVLTLRSPNDINVVETSSVTLEYLFQNYGISVPTKLPYGLDPRRDDIIKPVLPND